VFRYIQHKKITKQEISNVNTSARFCLQLSQFFQLGLNLAKPDFYGLNLAAYGSDIETLTFAIVICE